MSKFDEVMKQEDIDKKKVLESNALDEGYYEVDKSVDVNPSVEEFHFEDEVVFVCHPDQMNVQNSVYSVSVPMPSEELDNCQMDGDNDEPYANEIEAKNINSIEIHISDEEDN